MLNIPIYRAKKIDSDEYIEGYLTAYAEKVFDKTKVNKIRIDAVYHINDDEIDLSTLAIHFPDMIDSEGTKIFASLSEDGKGGDIVMYGDYIEEYQYLVKYIKSEYKFYAVGMTDTQTENNIGYKINPRLKVTGIQQ